jgi:hypothetical protein
MKNIIVEQLDIMFSNGRKIKDDLLAVMSQHMKRMSNNEEISGGMLLNILADSINNFTITALITLSEIAGNVTPEKCMEILFETFNEFQKLNKPDQ